MSQPSVARQWIVQSARAVTPQLVELVVLASISRGVGIVQPLVFQALVDKVFPFHRVASLEIVIAVLAVAMLFATVSNALYNLLSAWVANSVTFRLGNRIFRHVIHLPLTVLQKYQIGDTIERIGEVDNVRATLTGSVAEHVADLLFSVIYLLVLANISTTLTFFVIVSVPIQIGAFNLLGPFLRSRLQEWFLAKSDHYSRLVEGYGNSVVVKALGAETHFADNVTDTLARGLSTGWEVAKIRTLNNAIGEAVGGLSGIFIIYVAAGMIFQGQLTLGELIAFHLISEKVAGPVKSLSTVWEKWMGFGVSQARLDDFVNIPTEQSPPRPPLIKADSPVLAAENISFSYGDDHDVLSGFSAKFRPCMVTVLVGDSGCGKSTLGKLLAGFYTPSKGRIVLGGRDISLFDPVSVRRVVSYVPQEPVLFNGTIESNVRMSNPNISEADVAHALRISACEGFVSRLPSGVKTTLGASGQKLSGGERQRVALARSLALKPDVLVLDEPTSSLDDEAAKTVMTTLMDIARHATVIIITHRPDLVPGETDVIEIHRR